MEELKGAVLVLEYIKTLKWPATLIVLLLIYREAIIALATSILPKSKIKVSLFGVEVETTLPELKSISLESLGGSLKKNQLDLLTRLGNEGSISYEPKGVSAEQCKWIRPMRNAGLIETYPVDAYLEQADSLHLTPLGKLLVRSIKQKTSETEA